MSELEDDKKWAHAYTPQCTSTKNLMVSIRWYLGFLNGQLGAAGGDGMICDVLLWGRSVGAGG